MSLTIQNQHDFCFDHVLERLASTQPFFLGRIGGSDTSAVAAFNAGQMSLNTSDGLNCARDYINFTAKYNGYYDKDGSIPNFIKYLKILLESYTKCDDVFFVCRELLSIYFSSKEERSSIYADIPKLVTDHYRTLVKDLSSERAITAMPYSFVESLTFGESNLFRAFSIALANKRVVVVSPFSKSIESNFSNRKRFFRDYNYPDFSLQTYNTPITYSGLPTAMYPDDCWSSSLSRMQHEIGSLDFDIALLSCGSYAMPLGIHIRDKLERSAIYVGGVLQLFFGIMGRRYQSEFVRSQIDDRYWIEPIERSIYLNHVRVEEKDATEGFGAYF